MDSVLKVDGLNKYYGSNQAVKNLSFEVKKGQVFGILGPNGSGKSTTLSILLNILKASSGNFQWFSGDDKPHLIRRRIGSLLDRPNFYPYLSANDNLKIVCDIKGINYSTIDLKLEQVGLIENKFHKFNTFSYGMKQRLALASAILGNPEVLLFDEPTNGLDPEGIYDVRNIIKNVSSNDITIILASHLLDEVEKVCSHLVVLKKGERKFLGTVSELINDDGIVEIKTNKPLELAKFLETIEFVENIEILDDNCRVNLKDSKKENELLKKIIDNGYEVNQFKKIKTKLEEKFIELLHG